MPKYWGKQIFAHGSFPDVGEKQKTERERKKKRRDWTMLITMAKLRMAHTSRLGRKHKSICSLSIGMSKNPERKMEIWFGKSICISFLNQNVFRKIVSLSGLWYGRGNLNFGTDIRKCTSTRAVLVEIVSNCGNYLPILPLYFNVNSEIHFKHSKISYW